MKVTVEENNPFVTVRVSLDRRKSGDSIQSVDTNFVIKLLEDRGIKISNIRKSAIIDNYTTNVPSSGEWEFRNAAFPQASKKPAKPAPAPAPPVVTETETKTSTSKRRRRNVSKSTTGSTKEN